MVNLQQYIKSQLGIINNAEEPMDRDRTSSMSLQPPVFLGINASSSKRLLNFHKKEELHCKQVRREHKTTSSLSMPLCHP